MKFSGKFVSDDYLKAQLLHMQQPAWIRVLLYIFYVLAGVALILGVWLSISGQMNFLYFFPVYVFAGVYLLYRYIFFPRQSRRIFEQSKELSLLQNFEITEAGLQLSNEQGSSLRPWKNFHKWKEGKDLLLLYLSDMGFLMIPKRFFTDPQQLEALRSHLAENGVKARQSPYTWLSVLVFLLIMLAVVINLYSSFVSGGG